MTVIAPVIAREQLDAAIVKISEGVAMLGDIARECDPAEDSEFLVSLQEFIRKLVGNLTIVGGMIELHRISADSPGVKSDVRN